MTEETDLTLETLEDENEDQEAEETVTEQVKTEKTFTQKDVDKIVRSRIAREKDMTSKAKTEFEEYKDSTELIIKEYEKSIQKEIEALSEHLPDNIKSILGKLESRDQLAWLTDPKNQIKNRQSPETPEVDSGSKNDKPTRRRRLV